MKVVLETKRGGQRIIGSGGGGKGGGSARTPVEQPDSLHNISYAAVLDAVGNGEMAGPVHADQPLRDIYLDGTPIQNADGSLNFRNVQVDYRVGTQDQEHIAGFPAAANVVSVGAEVSIKTPWSQLITNPDLSAVRVSLHWPQLLTMVESGKNAGDRVGARVEYAIDLAIGSGSFVNILTSAVDGKTVNGYTRTHRIDLPVGAQGWTVRVRRITPDSNNSAVQDRMLIQSYAEVVDGKFRYPMTALVGIRVDAEQFQAIPTRAYHWRGQVIRVPSNYDPLSRTYSGVWDGTFKRAWSNNPAWVFYDMLTNRLYGLGDRIDASMIDRYALYQIGAYCDQSVPDGQGGTEPRFVCNAYFQSSADALRVINDLTSVFRGMTYWANGQAVAVADMPSDPVYTYSNARVVDGRFNYIGADLTTLKTVALVSWNDPTDFYRAKVEVVTDYDGVRKHGIRKTEVVAFGCTSRGQAQRVGLYQLYTSRMEQGGVSFSVGLDGVIPQPGSLIKIADRNRAGRRLGGLVQSATSIKITLDAEHPVKIGDRLTVNLPSGLSQTRPVSAVNGRVVTVSPGFSQAPVAQAGWAVEADDLALQTARVISIKERDGITFDVSAVEHHPGKFDAIDHGVRLEPLPISVVPPRTQMSPSNVQIREHYVLRQGLSRHIAEITWDAVENALLYDVQWRRDNSGWVQVPRTGERLVEIPDFYTGEYSVRVRAINGLDVPSLWAYSDVTALTGQVSAPLPVTHLVTASIPWGIRLSWGFPTGPNIIERTEIRYSSTQDFADSLPAGSFAYPSDSFEQTGLAITTEHFFWARLIDKNGTLGPWYPAESAAGVRGVPSQVASEYNDLITSEIVEGGLGELLMGDIRDIPSIRDSVADINVDLTALNKQVGQINGQVQDLLKADEWDVGATYAVGTVVFADGKMYRAKKAVPAGKPVSDKVHWELIGDYASITDGLAALAVQSQETISRVEQAEGQIQANAEQISTVAGRVDDPESGLGALGSAVQLMRTQVGQLQDGLQSLSEATTALSSQVEGLEEAQSGLATAVSQLSTRVRTTEDKLEAQASSITQLKTDLGALASPSGNLLLDSNVELVRSTPTYLWGRYNLVEDLEPGQEYTLVVCYTHKPESGDTTSAIGIWAGGSSQKVGELDKGLIRSVQVIKFKKSTANTLPKELRFYYVPSPGTQAGDASIHWATLYKGSVIPAMEWQPSLASLQVQTQANASAVDGLSTKVTQHGNTITSQGESLTALQNEVRDPSTGLAATAGALNDTKTRVSDVEGKQEAMSSHQLVLNAEIKRQQAGEDAYLESVLNQYQTNVGLTQARAALSEFRNVQAEENRALAESIRIVQAELGGVAGQASAASAAVQETLQALVELEGEFTKVSAAWGIKLQANANGVRYVAGVGLDLTNESGVMQSTFAVLADRFAVMHATNGDPVTVFSVQGGASILNTALIGFASITEAKIADGAISRAKIQDAAIGHAQIENAAITSGKIRDAAITRAKIGLAEVDTLRIAGNSVTMHAARSGSGSLVINTAHGGIANIMVFYNGTASSSTVQHNKIVIRVNGWILAQFPALHIYSGNSYLPNIENPISKVVSTELNAGNNTIDVWAADVRWRPGIDPTPPPLLSAVDTVVLFHMR
ncbi:TipJ family phage tail tip protein [Alcaligenes phenolicus]|mgnify:CR=1 FL=1|uniref:TipJ family phage tail tip protein n=1 Tax=Alcaligenes phenolicus TaxID=232846 RepID=UPI002BD8D5DB|nr:phage tail protein [Alcaligenes phenolicus]HRO20810.1 phage tail protein [Alcaligenes phenolicus]HRP13642.1 phage tail protein [Alcaligenes phenolicus]